MNMKKSVKKSTTSKSKKPTAHKKLSVKVGMVKKVAKKTVAKKGGIKKLSPTKSRAKSKNK